MATKTIKNKRIQKNLGTLIKQGKTINKEVINLSDELVSASIATGEKWQNLMEKAIKNGTTLLANQQDMIFDTLESLKGQYAIGSGRFMKLIGWKSRTKKVSISAKGGKAKTTEVTPSIKKDNLKKIKGIGPKTEEILNIAGVLTFKDLATMKVQTLSNLLDAAGATYKAEYPKNWIKEAKAAAKK